MQDIVDGDIKKDDVYLHLGVNQCNYVLWDFDIILTLYHAKQLADSFVSSCDRLLTGNYSSQGFQKLPKWTAELLTFGSGRTNMSSEIGM